MKFGSIILTFITIETSSCYCFEVWTVKKLLLLSFKMDYELESDSSTQSEIKMDFRFIHHPGKRIHRKKINKVNVKRAAENIIFWRRKEVCFKHCLKFNKTTTETQNGIVWRGGDLQIISISNLLRRTEK